MILPTGMNIYFSGVGGTGVGPLAQLSQDAGHTIFGSDREKSPIFEDLIARGAKLSTDQSSRFMQTIHDENGIDLFVYTAALPDDHAELMLAKNTKMPITKRDGLLNRIIEDNDLKLIAISGTHGKTTTTGMLIWAMKKLEIPASYSIGTRLSFGPAAKFEKNSDYFIYEADEFDRNMLNFKPYISVITSVDYDHPDTYKTKDDYRLAFKQFIDQSEMAITWARDSFKADNIVAVTETNPEITLIGKHNRDNATLALETLRILQPEISHEKLAEALNSFPGTLRRFEKLGDRIYTDYAHHPVEISSTIELARELNDKISIVYQPHQNIRQHQLLKTGQYQDCFERADKVYWLPTYLSREDENISILSPEQLISTAGNSSNFIPSEMDERLAKSIKKDLRNGYLVIAMSAGDLDSWIREIARDNT